MRTLRSRFWLTLAALAACGPQAPPTATGEATSASSDATTHETSASSGAATHETSSSGSNPTSGEPTTATGDTSTTGTTSDPATTASTSTSSTGDPADTTGEPPASGPWMTCEENEYCTPEARVNADVAGETPLGPFAGSFVYVSAAVAFGDLGEMVILPEYATDLCAAAPRLRLELGYTQEWGDFVVEVPIEIDDGQGSSAQATAVVQVKGCCEFIWFCDCQSPSPYEVEVSVIADGWSLGGTARPNCCRSYSIDEAA